MTGTRRRVVLVAGVFAWVAAFAGAAAAFLQFEFRPGASGAAPAHWPAHTALARNAGGPTLVLFAHPHCPCTRASLDELAVVASHATGPVRAEVVFVQLDGFTDAEMRGESWHKAGRIPGVTRRIDRGGVEARRFGAATSGYTLVFDARGARAFAGGITPSRGQTGANAGRTAVTQLLSGRAAAIAESRVFGCALFDRHTDVDAGEPA